MPYHLVLEAARELPEEEQQALKEEEALWDPPPGTSEMPQDGQLQTSGTRRRELPPHPPGEEDGVNPPGKGPTGTMTGGDLELLHPPLRSAPSQAQDTPRTPQ